MKKLFWTLRIFLLALSVVTIPLVLKSCRCLDAPTLQDDQSKNVLQKSVIRDTILLRDSILMRDSIIYRERTIRDTVYITKEVYRDAHSAKNKLQNTILHDTILRTDSIVRIIEHPPRTYIPPFYKHCTTILWLIIAAFVAYYACKIYFKFRF